MSPFFQPGRRTLLALALIDLNASFAISDSAVAIIASVLSYSLRRYA